MQFGSAGRLCTFVDYNHEGQTRQHKTVAQMLADHDLLSLVSQVLTCQDGDKFQFKWLHGMTFVTFNLGSWETKSAESWTCHGHGQWRVKQDEFDMAKDMHKLAELFGML